MKLLLITADFPPIRSGEASHSFYLGQHLARRGVDVHVLTSQIPGVARPPGVTVHPLMRNWDWWDYPRFRGFIKECAPDGILLLLLMDMYDNHPLITFAPVIARSVVPGVRFVTQVEHLAFRHHWELPFRTRLGRKALITLWEKAQPADPLYGTLLRDSDHLIVLSGAHLEQLEERQVPIRHKTALIPPAPIMSDSAKNDPTSRRRGRETLGIKQSDFILIYYGYLYPGKGIETLLEAMHQVAARRPEARLVIAGGALEHPNMKTNPVNSTGYFAEAQAQCRRLGLAERVIWTGPCPADDERASLYLRAADLGVLPFDNGIFLNNSTFAAAVAHGLPVVTTRGDTLEAPFRDGENVLLCPPKDAAALASAIEQLIQDAALRERICRGAQQMAEDCFSWKSVIDRTLALFRMPTSATVAPVLSSAG